MKKTLYLNLLLLVAAFCATGWFSGCKEDLEPVWVVMASKSSFPFNELGGDSVLTVISNLAWTASLEYNDEQEDWVHLSSSGNKADEVVTLHVDTNLTSKVRTATVIFASQGKEPLRFEVSQKAAKLQISAIKKFTAYGGSQKTGVSSLVAWTFSKPAADTWYSVTRESDSLIIAVDPVLNAGSRTSILKISANGFPDETLKVEQEKSKINVSLNGSAVNTINVSYTGGDLELNVDCPVQWTILDKSYAEWLSVAKRAGVDEGNDHTGIIDIKAYANPYFYHPDSIFARKDSILLVAQGLDTVIIKLNQKSWESDASKARGQYIVIWEPGKQPSSIVMKQGTSAARKKEYTYTLMNVKADTKLAITFLNRTFSNVSMYGATGNGEINGSSDVLQYAFAPYVSPADIVQNAGGSWTFNERVITPWTIKQAGDYDITMVIRDHPNDPNKPVADKNEKGETEPTPPYIRFTKK
ncbi:MAG: hypothetical protein LBH19_01845 [Dysgonamonadaceae bacterium]|jgi:hypothetical protein|nr:hypothetical protein [Dysgonamonadaceae bacterium]